MGQKISSLILETAELILLAASLFDKEKFAALEKASLKIDLLKILLRLVQEIKILDNKKYLQLQRDLQEIGKMIGGWLRSIKIN